MPKNIGKKNMEDIDKKEVDATTENQATETTPSVEELMALYESEKAKANRILAEKKNEREKLVALENKLNEYSAAEKKRNLEAMSAEERYNSLLAEKENELLSYRQRLDEQEGQYKGLQRKIKLQSVISDIAFKEDIPHDVRQFTIESAFKDIDLDDVTQIKTVKNTFMDKYKSMILAKTPVGAGSEPVKESTTPVTQSGITKEQYLAMPKEERLKVSSVDRQRLMGEAINN